MGEGGRRGDKVTLERARSGDDRAFGELTGPYRGELQLHCYRILGSVQDAEDVLQETLLAAWRGLGQYEGRASLRTWLYRIATNRCLNALRASGRRPRTEPDGPSFLTTERPAGVSRCGWSPIRMCCWTGCRMRARVPRRDMRPRRQSRWLS